MASRSSRFEGQTALVTGAADGIGRACIEAFAAEGANVVIADIDVDKGQRLADELTSGGVRAFFVESDATLGTGVKAAVAAAMTEFGQLDVAVNNAGNLGGGDEPGLLIHECSEEQWDGTIGISLRSAFLAMKHELAVMVPRRIGAIVNISSIFGLTVSPTEYTTPGYSAAKAAVQHLTRLAAVTYGPLGIRVNAVAPGITATPGVLRDLPEQSDRDALALLQPLGRMVEPSEQADVILFMASREAAMVSGQVLGVDGAWSAL